MIRTKRDRLLSCAALLALALGPGAGAAAPAQSQDLAAIRAAAQAFAQAAAGAHDAEIRIGRLDPRLNLAACEQPLEAFLPPGPGGRRAALTVGVRCPGARPWTLYVPVTVRMMRPVAVLTAGLARGHVLGAGDLAIERRDVGNLAAGWFADGELPIGQVLRRNLRPGTVLTAQHVEAPIAVRRGARVLLAAGGDGIDVQMRGEALADGAVGERVPVRNLRSRRVVEGVVRADGSIEVAY